MTKHYLMWEPVSGAVGYRVYYRPLDTTQLYPLADTPVHQLDIMPYLGILTYPQMGIQVCAINENGEEGFYSVDLVIIMPLPAPQNVRLE